MKKYLCICFVAISVAVLFVDTSFAAWGKCVGCHFGVIAPSKKSLKEKFTMLEDFVKGAMDSESSMMEHVKKNPDGICDAAQDIGYKQQDQKEK